LRLHASAGIEHDSNILRTPQATSDRAAVLGLGVQVDKRYSLQRLTLDATATRWRYRDFDGLNYHTLDYRAAWDFSLTPRLRGVLSAQQRQWRDILDISPDTTRINRRSERRELAQASWQVAGGWRLIGGLDHTRVRSDDPRALEASPDVSSVHLGGGYETAAGARLTALVRRGEGSYGSPQAGPDFRETEPSVALHWPATSRTRLDLRVGHLRRRHDSDGSRDFSGMVASGGLAWQFSPRTGLEASVARDLGSYEFTGGGEVRGWRWSLGPSWKPSAKTTLRLRQHYQTRDWFPLSPASPDVGREDRLRITSLALEWEPTRALRLLASARHEQRSSSLAAYGFRANVVNLTARLGFF
jgi:exopolysaccharide biosynthesis operon protein EpsL